MTAIYLDPPFSDQERREALFAGNLMILSPRPSTLAFIQHAKDMIVEAFGELDPPTAQAHMTVQEYATLLTDLKPRFIHHERSKDLIRAMLTDLGAAPDTTYFDVPRMRTSTSDNYLTSGIAYAFHPHRDTWYSAPYAQINWWMPIYPVEPDNVMAVHPRYFDQPVKNGSAEYDYDIWNETGRKEAASQIGIDTRKQPKPEEEVELDPQIRVVTPPGGVLMFSGGSFHSSVPNTSGKTRFSIDFRTVSLDDLQAGRAAPNVDALCTGTTLRDFLRVSDLEKLPESEIAPYDVPRVAAAAN